VSQKWVSQFFFSQKKSGLLTQKWGILTSLTGGGTVTQLLKLESCSPYVQRCTPFDKSKMAALVLPLPGMSYP
jgi:hypothetical protein